MEPEKSTVRTKRLTSMRKVIAQRMCESLTQTAQFTLTREMDVDVLLEYIQEQKDAGQKVKLMHVLIKATASLLKEHEMLNASIDGTNLLLHDTVNMGVAVALPGGLLVPVVRDADTHTVTEIGKSYEALVAKARTGRIPLDEMSGATFTISNLGMAGIDGFTPIVNYPEAGILGVGRTNQRLYLDENGTVRTKRTIVFSLTVDHRVVDGYTGAQFLASLADVLSDKEKLLCALEA